MASAPGGFRVRCGKTVVRALRNADESHDFLKVPMAVPPMIEHAFSYHGDERYVSMGFGAHGGEMSDFVVESPAPDTPDLYRSFLLHRAIRPYTQAFRIEAVPPDWLEAIRVEKTDLDLENFQAWSETARCLLLDRESRQFFVGTVVRVRTWMILRPILFRTRKRCNTPGRPNPANAAEEALWTWLNAQPQPVLPAEFLEEWEREFRERQAISGCIAAGVKLGFNADEVREMVIQAFGSPGF